MSPKLGEEAFRLFAELSQQERTYAEVARRLGVCRGTVARTAKRENWVTRLQAIEKKAREKSDEEFAAKLAEMNARHQKLARFLIGKGIESLQGGKIEDARKAVEALELGVRLEREIAGLENPDESVVEIE